MRSIIEHFFPVPCARREAFLEHVGRGLSDLGWQLTDSCEGAVI